MKNILNEVISNLKSEKNGYCRIRHKRGWLEYLEDGDMVLTPQQLHKTLRMVIDRDNYRPRGEKLLCLRRKYKFTARSDKTPYRTEEALERFIVVSNSDNFFNQIPIGGRKESIDIGIKMNRSRFAFVELKPWKSSNSPLYAIVESLKNLIEYRIILERAIKDIKTIKSIELIILAPVQYCATYRLMPKNGTPRSESSAILKKMGNNISAEFMVGVKP